MSYNDESSKHDSYDDNGYKKRCYCEKCKRTYDEWCDRNKEKGHKICKRKCYTICEVKCEQPKTIVKKWGYKKEFEGKWEHYDDKREAPKHCKKCQKDKSDCSCHKKQDKKHAKH